MVNLEAFSCCSLAFLLKSSWNLASEACGGFFSVQNPYQQRISFKFRPLNVGKPCLNRLREAMGITPKSERGAQNSHQIDQTALPLENLTPAQQELLAELEKKDRKSVV